MGRNQFGDVILVYFRTIPVRTRKRERDRVGFLGPELGLGIQFHVGGCSVAKPQRYWKRIESIYSFQSATIHHSFISWETKEFVELFCCLFLFFTVVGTILLLRPWCHSAQCHIYLLCPISFCAPSRCINWDINERHRVRFDGC